MVTPRKQQGNECPALQWAFTARCVLTTNEEIAICPSTITFNHSQHVGVVREIFSFISNANSIRHYSLTPCFLFRTWMLYPGRFPVAWTPWLSHFVSLHLKSWTSRTDSFTICLSMLVSEHSGGQKQPTKRRALYMYMYLSYIYILRIYIYSGVYILQSV